MLAKDSPQSPVCLTVVVALFYGLFLQTKRESILALSYGPADRWTEFPRFSAWLVSERCFCDAGVTSPSKNCPLLAGGRLFLLFLFTDEYDDCVRRGIYLRSTT